MRIKHEHLKRLRVQAGWTQEEVAAKCKIDVRTYRKYERGEVNKGLSGVEAISRSDQYDVLDRIAASFSLSGPEELIEAEAPTGKPAADVQFSLGPGSPYHPAWYVHRDAAERKALNRLRTAGAPVVLQGPWLSGKATLLSHLLQKSAAESTEPNSTKVVQIDFFDLDESSFASLDALLRTLGHWILTGLGVPKGDMALNEAWKAPASEKQKLTSLLKRHAPPPGQRLFLAIERVDRLQNYPFMNDFFILLRGWAEASMEEPFSRLRLLCTVATEPTLLENTDHSSFFALANPIRLADFDTKQVAQLAALHQLNATEAEIEQLMALVGGHPYLCRTACYEAMISETPLSEVLAAVDWTGGVFAQHLSHLRGWIRQSPNHGEILRGIGSVLDDGGRTLPFLEYCKLYSKGILVEEARGAYRLRCKLYEDYFRGLWERSRSADVSGPVGGSGA